MATSATATFLFTDVVGSTAVAASLDPRAADDVRRRHFAQLREAIADTAGTEVKNIGDGLMVVFSSIGAAIDCAVRMQQAVERDNRRARVPVGLRVGLGHGDAIEEAGDWYGLAVVEAARLCSSARGGQILVTDAIRLLGGRGEGHRFMPVAPLTLKGFPEPVGASEVAWEAAGAPDAMPPRLRAAQGGAFVGREGEREAFQAAFGRAAEGRLQVVLLCGEPGIGKTTLAAETAAAAAATGATVLYGHCDEDVGVPYGAWAEALGHYVEHAEAAELERHVAEHGAELARLVPHLRRRVAGAPDPHTADPESERYLLFSAVTGLVAGAARDRPAVVVLDDLHWADKPALVLLQHLVTAATTIPVLVIGTYRQTDLGPDQPLTDALAELHRSPHVSRMTLAGLADEDVVALLAARAGHVLDADVEELARVLRRETDGNPFFVSELLRSLAESGGFARVDGRWTSQRLGLDELPNSIREVITRRVRRLGRWPQTALGAAAVLGREFDGDLLARVLDAGEHEVAEALDAAVDAGLLVPADGRFAFAHTLVQRSLSGALGKAAEQRLHRRAAEALEELCGDDPGPRIVELAHHWLEGARRSDAAKAVDYAVRAGDGALDQLAADEAIRWYHRGLQALAGGYAANDRTRCELLVRLGDALRQAGDPSFRATLLGSAMLAQELGDTELLVRSALTNTRGFASALGSVDEERVEVLEAALAANGRADSPARARLLAQLASELTFSGQWDRRVALSDEALALARRLGFGGTLGAVLTLRFVPTWAPETLEARTGEAQENVEAADRLGHPRAQFHAVHWRAVARVEAGDLAGARADAARATELAEALGQPTTRWLATGARASLAAIAGRLPDAERLAGEALGDATASSQPDGRLFYALALAGVRFEQGRLAELRVPLAETAARSPGVAALRGAIALACASADEPRARALLEVAIAGLDELPRDPTWLSALALFALTAHELGDARAAAALYERMAPWAGQIVFAGMAAWMAVDHHLGVLAGLLGRPADARAHLDAAATLHERIGAPVWLARTRVEQALAARDAVDGGEWRASLEEARDVAERHGAEVVERRAEEALARAVAAPAGR